MTDCIIWWTSMKIESWFWGCTKYHLQGTKIEPSWTTELKHKKIQTWFSSNSITIYFCCWTNRGKRMRTSHTSILVFFGFIESRSVSYNHTFRNSSRKQWRQGHLHRHHWADHFDSKHRVFFETCNLNFMGASVKIQETTPLFTQKL